MDPIVKRILTRIGVICAFFVSLVILFFIGIYVGYVVIGHGKSSEAFNWQTWQHILDFMN